MQTLTTSKLTHKALHGSIYSTCHLTVLCISILFCAASTGCGGAKQPQSPQATHPLNDTGIQTCLNADVASATDCPQRDFPNQDAEFGADSVIANSIKIGAGNAGFDFTKIGASGEPLLIQGQTWSDTGDENSGTQWSCVRDNTTGMLWEIKNNNMASAHYLWHTYSWYTPVQEENGGVAGSGNLGQCSLTRCDTLAYAFHANTTQLCGKTNWRLPDVDELLSIVDQSQVNPAIDSHYFPNTQPNAHWTRRTVAGNTQNAWYVYFTAGGNGHLNKNSLAYIRLVSE